VFLQKSRASAIFQELLIYFSNKKYVDCVYGRVDQVHGGFGPLVHSSIKARLTQATQSKIYDLDQKTEGVSRRSNLTRMKQNQQPGFYEP
jgi:hypothetical protein